MAFGTTDDVKATPALSTKRAGGTVGYSRIEHEAGGAERLDIPASNAGLIDKGPDARANLARA